VNNNKNFPLPFDKKPYFSFKQFLIQKFGFQVYKLPVDAGLTCPNRDGKISHKGCIYCYNPGFSPAVSLRTQGIYKQIQYAKKHKLKKDAKFLVYFQPYTNTYAPPDKLKQLYDEALNSDDNVVGLCIGTRPDCVTDEILDIIHEYTANYHIWIEYGLQSIHDKTLQKINRGHNFAQFEDAIYRTKKRKDIFICVHVILGLPGETSQDMLKTVQMVSSMGIHGIKFHHLHVIKNTPLYEEFKKGNIKVFSFEEYVPLICDMLEHLAPNITVQRLFGEVLSDELLIAPRWNKTKQEIIGSIEYELLKRGSFQGKSW
jgi:hypothetical protein